MGRADSQPATHRYRTGSKLRKPLALAVALVLTLALALTLLLL
eukprot:COSAG02_NODE_62817_length_265_cov_0.487952_1_plen_42_part_01